MSGPAMIYLAEQIEDIVEHERTGEPLSEDDEVEAVAADLRRRAAE